MELQGKNSSLRQLAIRYRNEQKNKTAGGAPAASGSESVIDTEKMEEIKKELDEVKKELEAAKNEKGEGGHIVKERSA